MYSSMQQTRLLRSLSRPCRIVAHRRYPAVVSSPLRRFHLSQPWRSSTPSDPNDARDSVSENTPSENSPLNGNHNSAAVDSGVETTHERLGAREAGPYGSAVRRALRNKRRAKESVTPTVVVPDWFRERNTVVNVHADQVAAQAQQQVNIRAAVRDDQPSADAQASGGHGDEPPSSEERPDPANRYALTDVLWEELCASARAGLRLPPAKYATEPSARKSHLVLHYPGFDGISFLDAVIKRLAQELGADLVTLNAQDIAQLCIEQDLADTGKTSPIRLLGYDVYRPSISNSWQEPDEGGVEEDEGEVDLEIPRSLRSSSLRPNFIAIESPQESRNIPLPGLTGLRTLLTGIPPAGGSSNPSQAQADYDQAVERRSQLLHKLLSSPGGRSESPLDSTTVDHDASKSFNKPQPQQPRDIIVQVQDYADILSVREGSRFLTILQKVIQDRRKDGHRVLFIGTTAQDVPPGSDSSRLLQNTFDDQFSQMVVVTPAMKSEMTEKIFAEDWKKRTLDINIRHIQSMLRTRLEEQPSSVEDEIFQRHSWPLDPAILKEAGLNERYWSYNQVHWAATLALGSVSGDETFGFEHIRRGLEMIRKTDHIRNEWLHQRPPKTNSASTEGNREQLLASLRKTCNSHEKKLLNGVVDAKSIRTTFADVHVPPETVDAIKTLTSLSLIRPEAFTSGYRQDLTC